MIRVVSIKFRDAGKLYDFNAGDLELKTGNLVVVETERGRALGTVVVPPREIAREELAEEPKTVLRQANEDDREMAVRYQEREKEAYRFCRARIAERRMEMKLVRAEYLYDGSKIIFYFTADGRVDFRELVKDLAHYFHTRIEMRQIGVRDEAKLLGGIGICGRELCCCTFLRDFNPVSVKMAKEQGLALNPNKISGQCGRLLCCLGYEYETYIHLKRGLPKVGRIIKVGKLEAMVLGLDIFAGKVKVRFETGEEGSLTAEDIERGEIPSGKPGKPAEEPQAATQPAKPVESPGEEGDKPKRRRSRGRSGRGRGKKNDGAQNTAEGAPAAPAAARQSKGPKQDQGQRPKKSERPPGKSNEGKPEQAAQPTDGERKRRPRRRSRKKEQ